MRKILSSHIQKKARGKDVHCACIWRCLSTFYVEHLARFAIKIAFYFYFFHSRNLQQNSQRKIFCFAFSLEREAGALAYLASRRNLFTDIHRESVNFFREQIWDPTPLAFLSRINFNLHAWTLEIPVLRNRNN